MKAGSGCVLFIPLFMGGSALFLFRCGDDSHEGCRVSFIQPAPGLLFHLMHVKIKWLVKSKHHTSLRSGRDLRLLTAAGADTA